MRSLVEFLTVGAWMGILIMVVGLILGNLVLKQVGTVMCIPHMTFVVVGIVINLIEKGR